MPHSGTPTAHLALYTSICNVIIIMQQCVVVLPVLLLVQLRSGSLYIRAQPSMVASSGGPVQLQYCGGHGYITRLRDKEGGAPHKPSCSNKKEATKVKVVGRG